MTTLLASLRNVLRRLRSVLRRLRSRKPGVGSTTGVSAADGGEIPPSNPNPRSRTPTMNFKDLITEISQDTKIPAADVHKVGVAMLERFSHLIEEQQDFISPLVTLTAVTIPARPAAGDKPAMPERKFARMAIRQAPPAKPEAAPANPQP